MAVDERYVERWRQEQERRREARWRRTTRRKSSLAIMARTFEAPDKVDDRYRSLWQSARVERWPVDTAGLSHEAYLAWWRANGGAGDGHTLAHHFEAHLRRFDRPAALCRLSIVEAFDWFFARYSPLLAAEAFRRWLRARAKP